MKRQRGSIRAQDAINLLHELLIAVMVSTHGMALVQELFPRTVAMDDGRIVADGLAMDILEDEVLLEAHGLEKLLNSIMFCVDCATKKITAMLG